MFELSVTDLAMLSQVRHPQYLWYNTEWNKWRLTMAGGKAFLDAYLEKFDEREDDADFDLRKALSYCAGYAKSAVHEIINAIFQRMRDITRVGGPESYISSVAGRSGGINREGMSMNMFMGQKILPELLSMGKVGIYIDMPEAADNATLAETYRNRPYIYFYPVEDILNWNYTNQELRAVVLRDQIYTYDEKTSLPTGTDTRYRYLWQDAQGSVYAVSYTGEYRNVGGSNQYIIKDQKQFKLNIKRIPFIILDIGESLLTDVADHQIALTNLESSDIGYIFRANFPLYTEQENNKIKPTHTKQPGEEEAKGVVETGPLRGRKYPLEAERPGFIHPSPDPLKAAIEKEEQIKAEIRHLVQLAVSKLNPQRESADSKQIDNVGLEAGLSFIGLNLEHAENFIAERWAEYMGGASEIATVKYPSQYSLLSDADRRKGAKDIFDMRDDIPSRLGRKEMTKLAITTLFDGRVSPTIMDDILDEVDKAPYISGRTEDIERDKKEGLVTADVASQARGYEEGQAEKAKEEYLERLKMIAEVQGTGTGPGNLTATNTDAANNDELKLRDTISNKPAGDLKNPAARGVRDLSPAPDANAAQEKTTGM